jgi:hypothetical protein
MFDAFLKKIVLLFLYRMTTLFIVSASSPYERELLISYASVVLSVPEGAPFCICGTGPNVIAARAVIGFRVNHQDDVRNVGQEKYLKELSSMMIDLMEKLRGGDGRRIS